MKLSSLLKPDYILIGKDVRTKGDAVKEILSNFSSSYKFKVDNDYLLNAINEREKLGGTTFPSGIAIPHARLDDFDDILIGALIPKEPIMDGSTQIRMVVLIFTSKTVSNVYLNTLASLIKVSRDKAMFDEICHVQTGSDFVGIVDKLGIKVGEEVGVADIMSEEVISVKPEATLKEIIDLFYKHNFGYIPVIDENGEFVGEVNLHILIEEGIPDYATQLGNLNFLKTFEPLERLFRKEDIILAKDIMRKPSIVFTKETSIVEAALEFTKTKRRHISVVEDRKVVGVLALKDILTKILRS